MTDDAATVFDLNRFIEDGALVVGGKGSGKTNLAKIFVSLMPQAWEVKVFDVSQAWNNTSPIGFRWEADSPAQLPRFVDSDMVYDLSRLYIGETKALIYDIIRREFEAHLESHVKPITVFIFEEGQMYFKPSVLRSRAGEEPLRLITVGRNQGFSYIITSQRPQLLDTSVWELCGQRFIGRIFRPKPYFSPILGAAADTLTRLKRGEFLYQRDDETRVVKSAKFESGQDALKLNVKWWRERKRV